MSVTIAMLILMAMLVSTAMTATMSITTTAATIVIADFALGQAGKGSILPGDLFLVADTRMEIVCSQGCLASPSAMQTYGLQRARLENLHGYRQSSG